MPDDELDVIDQPSDGADETSRWHSGRRPWVSLVLVLVLASVGAYWMTKNSRDGVITATACNSGDLFERGNANAVLLLRPGTDPQSVWADVHPGGLRVAELVTRTSAGAERAFQMHVRFSAGSTDGDVEAFVGHVRRIASVIEVTVGPCPLQ